MRLINKILYSVTGTTVSVLSGFIRNKIYAVYLSLSIFGILSITQQGLSIVFTLFALGFPVGIAAYSSKISTWQLEAQKTALTKILLLVSYQSIIVLCLLIFFFLFFPKEISYTLTGNVELVIPVFLVLLASPFMIFQNSLSAIMEGMGLVKKITTFKIIPSLTTLPIIFILVSNYHLTGAAVSTLLVEVSFFIFALITLKQYFVISLDSFKVNQTFKEIGKVAIASASVGFIWMITDFLVKRYILETMGLIENGIIQSIAKVTDLYPLIALSWLNIHLFPTLAASIQNKKEGIAHIERTVLIAVSITIPIIFVLLLSRVSIIELLYNRDFIIAEDYFAVMLVSGIFKVASWVVGVALLPLGLRKEWLFSSIAYILIYIILILLGLGMKLGIYVIPFATIGGLISQLFFTLFLYRMNKYFFTNDFFIQCILFIIISILIYFSRVHILYLILAFILYFFMLTFYRIISELITRWKDVLKKISE